MALHQLDMLTNWPLHARQCLSFAFCSVKCVCVLFSGGNELLANPRVGEDQQAAGQ